MGVFSNPARTRPRSNPGSRPRLGRVPAAHPAPAPAPASTGGSARLPYSVSRTMTAAASPISLNDPQQLARLARRRAGDAWQQEAWEYYDAIGEIKYAFHLVANILSRVRLFAGQLDDPSLAPKHADNDTPGGAAAHAALSRLDSAFGGQPGLMRDTALNMCITGECFLVQRPGNPALGIRESWDVRSTDELEIDAGGQVFLKTRADMAQNDKIKLPKSAFMFRIWRPHPRYSDEADSSMRGLLDACSELLLLNRTFRAIARSRLNAGLLYLPDGLSAASSADPDVTPDEDPEGTGVYDLDDGTDMDDIEEALVEAMTTPIADESSASAVVPLIMRGPAELGRSIVHLKFERAWDAQLIQRAHALMDRIMQGLDVPKDIVAGLANVKYCLSEDTEILTRRGWITYDQLATDDEALTLNHETGLSEWQRVLSVNVFDSNDEPMLFMESSTHSSISTLNHRWPTIRKHRSYGQRRMWATSETLTAGDRIITSAQCGTLPTEQKYDDDLVELIAWFYTEGCYSPRTNRNWSGLGQSIKANPEKVERIRAALTRLVGPASERILVTDTGPHWRESVSRDGTYADFHFNHELTEQLKPFFVDMKRKVVDLSFINSLTRAQLELFVAVSILADGHGTTDLGMVWQEDVERLDAPELACALLGVTTRRIQDGHFLRITRRRPLVRPSHEQSEVRNYTGKVWCPTTENQSWFARRNGKSYFTGNTNAQMIDDSLIRSHIEPLAIMICDALTVGYLHPMLKSAGVSDYELEKYVVWYDATDVTQKQTKTDDVEAGYKSYTISGATWRREHGFTEDDAPTPTEIALRMMIEKGPLQPDLVESMLQVFVPDVMDRVRAVSRANNPQPLPGDVLSALGGQPPPGGAPADATADGTNPPPPPPAASDQPASPPPAGGTADNPQVIDPATLV